MFGAEQTGKKNTVKHLRQNSASTRNGRKQKQSITLLKKTTKRKYVQYVFSENEIPPLIEDETPFTLPEPKFEDFDSFYRRNQMNQTPNHFKKEEIRGFLQVCQLMSIAPIPNYANYWTGSGMDHALYACKLIQRVMSRRRFQEIHTFLSSEPQIIEDKINSNSRKYWLCVREDSVDEIIAAFKGKVRFKQYIPLKPHKYGLKHYALSDSTGYIYAFWLYQGKESRYTHNPTSIVLDLVAHISPENHILGVDNYYGSLELATKLSAKGWRFVMTVKGNRPTFLFNEGLQKKLPGTKTKQWIHAVNKEKNFGCGVSE
ncbi:hypothetical protein FDP41_013642 [Naegleria fowleri]|uniref:PiggyBac transposable element-derived protein domain-containing protein n=1 Tax=Naegleria fowleri TaxID=5763 RepID=A0A6A5C3I6_NAEFO|nr:uncharacterized protein FDP41_013642 [Naegleria fowleri]KAF0980428.1 hypothetical protein FDP41_013642 [Naegleria fowleri]